MAESLKSFLVLLLWALIGLVAVAIIRFDNAPQQTFAAPNAQQFYVSKTGNGADGRTWATAWKDVDQIAWASVSAGDTVYLDGGSVSMTFTGTLVPKSGTTILLSQEAGRNGQAVLFGGRTILLPDCDSTYTPQTTGTKQYGIDVSTASNVTIDGGKWSGIVVHGYGTQNQTSAGIKAGGNANTLRNIEVYDNGHAVLQGSGKYRSDYPGVLLAGTNLTFDRMLIHDNGQDAFQSSGGLISGLTVSNSWLYNLRAHPSNPSLAFNYCMHSDGMQIYNGGVHTGITFSSVILGPGLMQGTLLGQTGSPGAIVNNVTMNNVLALDSTNANLMGYDGIVEQNWHIDHVTLFHVLYDPDNGQHHQLLLRGTGHSFNNSIIYGGGCYVPDGISTTGDFRFNTTCTFGTQADPQFVGAPAYNSQPSIQDLANGDYSLQPGSPATGKGSALTSVAMLLGQAPPPQDTPTQASTPTVVPTGIPTAPPTATQTGVPIPTGTFTRTPTSTPTSTPSPTQTPTTIVAPTFTPTYTPSVTPTRTGTPTITPTSPPLATATPTDIVITYTCVETVKWTGESTFVCTR